MGKAATADDTLQLIVATEAIADKVTGGVRGDRYEKQRIKEIKKKSMFNKFLIKDNFMIIQHILAIHSLTEYNGYKALVDIDNIQVIKGFFLNRQLCPI